ncbi:MAG: DUF3857 domain-containing protein [Flavobacteriaceae bacterium]|nr:DUF3857 domain-containing protein [Flavobacteriaceae bacterium]
MNKIILIIAIFTSSISFSQYYTTYDWEANPTIHTINDSDNMESSLAILKRKIIEFRRSETNNNISIFETTHDIIRLNDETGILRHNQVYIPMFGVKKLQEIKARTISKDGTVTNLDEKNIKKIENVEEYGDFQIFAIEGAEIDSEIEILYTVEKDYSPFGTEMLQSNYPIKRVEMVFITNGLSEYIKTYNTDQEFERTYLDNLLVEELSLSNIPKIAEEEYSATDANKIYAAYQCFGNAEITQELLWNNTIGNIAYGLFPKEVQPSILNEIKNHLTTIDSITTDFEKAAIVDNYIKTNFTVIDNRNSQLEEIDYILTNRSSSDIGILKVYAHFLTALEIPYEIVVTSNRYTHRFDPEFFNPGALREFLIYLPKIKQYISPTRIDYRLSEAPANILGNYGVFIDKNIEYYFDKITQSDPDYSRIIRNMDISFIDDFERVKVDESQKYYGHWGVQNRAFMALTSGESKAGFEDYLTGSGIEDKKVISLELENTEMNQLTYNLPYIVNSTIESSTLIQDAGGSYIFEVGKIIGTQSELYQEKKRENPIEMQYPNQYNYSITVAIPEGYSLDGLESLVINKELVIDGIKLCWWHSNYEIKDNQLVITIEESYRVNDFPIEHYEGFRQVINAASDFNKAAILFTEE